MRDTHRMTKRFDLVADARLASVMERRTADERSTVACAVVKLLLWTLTNYANDDGEAFPSVATLAAEVETSARTVRRAMEILVEEEIVTVTNRTRGAAAGAKREAKDGATNLYRIDYERLRTIGRDGGQPDLRSGSNVGQYGRRTSVNMADESEERRPTRERTEANESENGGQIATCAKDEPSEPVHEPPPTPGGGEAGGEGDSMRDTRQDRSAPTTDRGWAAQSAPGYTFVANALALADEDALVQAYVYERTRHDGATPAEIAGAIDEFALRCSRGEVTKPMALRFWVKQRGYWPFVAERRRLEAEVVARDQVVVAGKIVADADEERARLAMDRASTDAELDRLSAAEYSAIVAKVRAELPDVCRTLGDRSRPMRILVASRLRERRAEVVAC